MHIIRPPNSEAIQVDVLSFSKNLSGSDGTLQNTLELIDQLEIDAGTGINLNCSVSENVGDFVYFINGEARKADFASIDTARVIGVIVSKSSDTTCTIKTNGLIDIFTGLTGGARYFLSSNGSMSTSVPTAGNSVIVALGQAVNTNLFYISLNNQYIIRS